MFKQAILAALATAGLMAAAAAADLPTTKGLPPAPAYMPYNWSGLYVGINGGAADGTASFRYTTGGVAGHPTNGGLIGGTVGYNWQYGALVYGLETDFDGGSITGINACPNPVFSCETKLETLGTARARFGYAYDRLLFFATGGLAYGDQMAETVDTKGAAIPPSGTPTNRTSKYMLGGAIGGGLEYALTNNLSLKLEGLYYNLGTGSFHVDNANVVRVNPSGALVRFGLNWKFDWGAPAPMPVMAKY